MTLVVNGRFLASPHPAGVHRAGRSLIDGLRGLEVDLEVLAPWGTRDPQVDRSVAGGAGPLGGQIFEQATLPIAARSRPVLSLANTGPMMHRRQAIFLYDTAFLRDPRWFAPSHRRYYTMVLRAARDMQAVLVPSRQVREEVIATGVKAQRVVVVPLAVDPSARRAPASEQQRVRSSFGLSRPFFLMVGWGDPRKGLDVAIAAHAPLSDRADLVLVGRPHPRFGKVTSRDVSGVTQLPRVRDSDLWALMSAAEALIFPSRYEGFGLPPSEAAACGSRAIVSDIPVLRECCSGASLFVAPTDVPAWTQAMEDAMSGQLAKAESTDLGWRHSSEIVAGVVHDLRVV